MDSIVVIARIEEFTRKTYTPNMSLYILNEDFKDLTQLVKNQDRVMSLTGLGSAANFWIFVSAVAAVASLCVFVRIFVCLAPFPKCWKSRNYTVTRTNETNNNNNNKSNETESLEPEIPKPPEVQEEEEAQELTAKKESCDNRKDPTTTVV
jgi:hypothetical protein